MQKWHCQTHFLAGYSVILQKYGTVAPSMQCDFGIATFFPLSNTFLTIWLWCGNFVNCQILHQGWHCQNMASNFAQGWWGFLALLMPKFDFGMASGRGVGLVKFWFYFVHARFLCPFFVLKWGLLGRTVSSSHSPPPQPPQTYFFLD